MPIDKLHTEEGRVLRQCGALITKRDDSARWQLGGDQDADELRGYPIPVEGLRSDLARLEVAGIVRC